MNLFADADAYERWVGRWSRRVAPDFLSALDTPKGAVWLDIGCGPGVVTEAINECCDPMRIAGLDPSLGLLSRATELVPSPTVTFVVADAQHMPFREGTFDAIVSGLVLNYVPNLPSATSEMRRVGRSGAVVGAYVWDYAGGMEMIRWFWDAAVELDTTARERDQRTQTTIARPDALENLFLQAGFADVNVWAIDIEIHFESFDDYWTPFLGGQGPAPSYVASLKYTERERLREHVRRRLPINSDDSIDLTARAWAVRGVV